MLIRTLCNNSPYFLLSLTFGYGVVARRKRLLKVLPSIDAFFWKLLACSIISVLSKYLFNGPRPECKTYTIPEGWVKKGGLSSAGRFTRILIEPKAEHAFLKMQPLREVYSMPLSLFQLKSRYTPNTGTPSSHSVLSGYVFAKSLRARTLGGVGICFSLAVSLSRIFYRYHYFYQVAIGLGIGVLVERLPFM
ncbi:hypothetical protein NEDG_00724 [Nematocida displodere]|uniref:Phosphatidic acid phosphatase type 2/haloperoxidase domain-containing protein n=1 Tax=Nematocida displodere TaxID=1805483 RepID=A0A177EDK3_9MICR|nr:hypothetical protein NEDG_00724 [Nematocida displodere]